MKRIALVSVSDRSGIVDFARGLRELGFELLVTSGTGAALAEAGIETLSIERYTGQREILDGRVKTLHPKIHAGLLARRDRVEHMEQLEREQIFPIEVVAVNLYPFVSARRARPHGDDSEMIELIDVGGPTMIRAAAKNFAAVYPVIDPRDYSAVLHALAGHGEYDSAESQLGLRRHLAARVFTVLAQDNLEVARYLTSQPGQLPVVAGEIYEREQLLRYGENPHQAAAFYHPLSRENGESKRWKQLQGKELSYNNLLDLDAAIRLHDGVTGDAPFVAILKHLNPCGAAYGTSLLDALWKAKRCDPRSHFGGIIVLRGEVDSAIAQEIREDFAEIIIAPAFTPDARALLERSKNLRVIELGAPLATPPFEIRSVEGGVLMQESDSGVSAVEQAEVVSRRNPTERELADLRLAWELCAHVKSNAIVVVKDGLLIGVGGGQMSRVDSVEVALMKARVHAHDLQGAVAASDAFFPFPDGPKILGEAGITAIVAPRGAKRDNEAIAVCDELEIALLFSEDRHFRH